MVESKEKKRINEMVGYESSENYIHCEFIKTVFAPESVCIALHSSCFLSNGLSSFV